MRSLRARGLSFSKLRRLSTKEPKVKDSVQVIGESTREEDRVYMETSSSEEESSETEVAIEELVDSHFDQQYLEHRQNLLAYGKQMTRSMEESSGRKESLGLGDSTDARPKLTESRSAQTIAKTSMKPPRPQIRSWVAKVMRDSEPGELPTSKSQRLRASA